MPRAAWQASASAAVTAWMTPHAMPALAAQSSAASSKSDTSAFGTLENSLSRSHGASPATSGGALRGAMGTKGWLIAQRSLIAARRLNQFIAADVANDSVR